ncbi:uncharacterized protein LOC120439311 isoform X3 [Oreochromis aureus]|uniref:uncharacterized protein LOC120439311 isoform X3 n=1 Tax=Oreochromis aureus TaxID=47969 RepID=UPI0019540674|nr:uncharacterized protein LOC120439311 isoform X3 [Oreochromis aureus]
MMSFSDFWRLLGQPIAIFLTEELATLLPVTRRDTGEQMEDNLNVEAAATEVELVEEEEETLVNKKNASSIVWQHFGFNKDDVDQKIVKCKLCKKTVASSQGVSSGTLVVTQSPDDISVMEGATVNITCCWPGKFGRVGVNWLKNQTVIKNEVKQNQSQGSLKEETKMCSSLNFSNIQTKDSGTYICKVTLEIPSLFEAKGNGTVITVREKTENDNGNSTRKESDFGEAPTKVIISLAVVVPLLLTTLVCYCTLRRKQALAARVIYEVPHVDSDVAEMDKHSTNSSLGSSQWRQVPLYESFYFEHVDPKESE